MHILNSKKGTYFLADTLINRHPDTETLIDIAKLSDLKQFTASSITRRLSQCCHTPTSVLILQVAL